MRNLVKINNELVILSNKDYCQHINKGIELKFICKIPHVRKKVKEPLTKKKLIDLVKKNVSILANKGEKNLITNFKWVVRGL